MRSSSKRISFYRHSVAGKKHNGLDIPVPGPRPTAGPNENMSPFFENRIAADENDRVIFSGGRRSMYFHALSLKKILISFFKSGYSIQLQRDQPKHPNRFSAIQGHKILTSVL